MGIEQTFGGQTMGGQTAAHVGGERRSADRRRRARFVLRERRTGFDRRTARPGSTGRTLLYRFQLHLRERPVALLVLLALANLLSLADYILTLASLEAGAREANPLLRYFFETDPRLAGLVKLCLVLGASLLIWRYRRYRMVLSAVLAFVAAFAFVVVYQAVSLLSLGP